LSDLTLDSTPLLDEHDIHSYEWESHTIQVKTQDVADRILKRKRLWEPFVVVVGGERLYLGTLNSGVSSFVPHTPVIRVGYAADEAQPRFAVRIHRPPIADTPDPRGNLRLKQALKALQLLDDSPTVPRPTHPQSPTRDQITTESLQAAARMHDKLQVAAGDRGALRSVFRGADLRSASSGLLRKPLHKHSGGRTGCPSNWQTGCLPHKYSARR